MKFFLQGSGGRIKETSDAVVAGGKDVFARGREGDVPDHVFVFNGAGLECTGVGEVDVDATAIGR